MKVLEIGLDQASIASLHSRKILVESMHLGQLSELPLWLAGGEFDSAIIHFGRDEALFPCVRELRDQTITTPLVGVSHCPSAREWSERRAAFLEAGGDDLLRAPVSARELVATLSALARRQCHGLASFEYVNGGARLKLVPDTRMVFVNGIRMPYVRRQLDLILILGTHPGRSWTQGSLITKMYGAAEQPDQKIIDVFVCSIRRRMLLAHPDAKFVQSRGYGEGYWIPEELRVKCPPQREVRNAA